MHGWRVSYFSSADVNAVFYLLLQWGERQFFGVIGWAHCRFGANLWVYNREMAQFSITVARWNQVQNLFCLWLTIYPICWLYCFSQHCLLVKCEHLILAVASFLISVLINFECTVTVWETGDLVRCCFLTLPDGSPVCDMACMDKDCANNTGIRTSAKSSDP